MPPAALPRLGGGLSGPDKHKRPATASKGAAVGRARLAAVAAPQPLIGSATCRGCSVRAQAANKMRAEGERAPHAGSLRVSAPGLGFYTRRPWMTGMQDRAPGRAKARAAYISWLGDAPAGWDGLMCH